MANNNKVSGLAGVLMFALFLGALSGRHFATDPSAYTVENDPYKPYVDYNPNSQSGACIHASLTPCNVYDFYNTSIPIASDCVTAGLDSDADGYEGFSPFSASDIPDPSCIVLEDWNLDGFCDHRVLDVGRSQSASSYEKVNTYHQYIGGGQWERITGGSVCFGWLVLP
jgi:hypothetical protein